MLRFGVGCELDICGFQEHQHSIFAHVCQDNGAVVAHVEQGRLVIVLSAV